jgi:parallel beta-helix repeat protein
MVVSWLMVAVTGCGQRGPDNTGVSPELPEVGDAALPAADACSGETSGLAAGRIVYVSSTGVASNSGVSAVLPKDLQSALDAVQPGETLLLAPGRYQIPYTAGSANTLSLAKIGTPDAPIQIVAAYCGRAEIDFQFPEQTWVQDSYGLSVTGSYYYLKGIDVTRAGYQGVYVTGSHNTFENCTFHDNRNTGLEINKGGAYTTVINCDAYRNFDPKKGGSMADGFGPKQTQGPGNKFIGCRAWENSDDGFDAYDSPLVVTFENCWAFRNGIDYWNYPELGFSGNGNGFKVGGNSKLANHVLTSCVSFGHPNKGFDQNSNTGGITLLNCTAYDNGTNFGLGGTLASNQSHVLKNNISVGAQDSIGTAIEQNNSWNAGFEGSVADFVSLDLSEATAARLPDGKLPPMTVFQLQAKSRWVDAGVDVGLGFVGAAPDLGAFEFAP